MRLKLAKYFSICQIKQLDDVKTDWKVSPKGYLDISSMQLLTRVY